MSKTSPKVELLPRDPVGRRLLQIFNHLWHIIRAPMPVDASQKPNWITKTGKCYYARTVWDLWLDAKQLVGVRFGSMTQYGMADIDLRSCYHPDQSSTAIAQLKEALETIGIYRVLILQSSWSRGLHIYIPLPEEVRTFDWAATLKGCLLKAGFTIKGGSLELFPNCKAYDPVNITDYMGHRLPLQPGSGSILLDDNCEPIPLGNNLAHFLQAWDNAAAGQDMETVRASIKQARKEKAWRHFFNATSTDEWKKNLESIIAQGWTEPQETNDLLRVFACYGIVFRGLQGKALVDFMVATAIAAPGYAEYCSHQHNIKERCQHWAKCAEKFYWPLKTPPIVRQVNLFGDLSGENNIVPLPPNAQRAEDAKARIRKAVADAIEQGTLPSGYTARLHYLIKTARTSPNTLLKNKCIWWDLAGSTSPLTPEPEPVLAISSVKLDAEPRSLESSPEAELRAIPPNEGFIYETGSAGSSNSQRTGRLGLSAISPSIALQPASHQDCSDLADAIEAVENSGVDDTAIAPTTSNPKHGSSEPNASTNATGDSDPELPPRTMPEQFSTTDVQAQAIANSTAPPAPPETVTPAAPNAEVPEAIAHATNAPEHESGEPKATGDSNPDLPPLPTIEPAPPPEAAVPESPPEPINPYAIGIPETLVNRDSDGWLLWSYYCQAIHLQRERLQLEPGEWLELLQPFGTKLLITLNIPQMQQLLQILTEMPDF